MASTVHEPSSQCSNSTCVYYPKIHRVKQECPKLIYRPSTKEYELFFPESCKKCSTLRITMDGLWPFCHHLRLQHLFYCLRHHHPMLDPCLELGSLADLQLRSGCTFCTFILRVVQKESQTLGVNVDGSDLVILSISMFSHFSESYLLGPNDLLHDADVQVCSSYRHTNTCLSTADEDLSLPLKLGAHLLVRQREPPNEWNTVGTVVNWQRLRTWIKECTDHHFHSDPIHPPGENVSEGLLFIDVDKKCIVSASISCNYVALSYVWGDHTAEMIQTTKRSIDNLRKVGSLRGHHIPATIRDAMHTCRVLGVPYLWVDRFCIVQDDELHKHEQIRSMSTIYSCALLTICATAGDNADYGLPGVRSRLRAQVRPRAFAFDVEVVPGRRDDNSTWNSRGWTYQEMVLSRRRLIFTDEDAFFECEYGASDETSAYMEPPPRLVSFKRFYHKDMRSYMNHVEKYTMRNLSYKSDVYNAFAGVGGSIYPSKDLIYGVPASAFDAGILWESWCKHTDGQWPRQNLGKDIYVLSWSWASEFGNTISYAAASFAFGSFAKWSFVEQQDKVRVIESVETSMGWDSSLSESYYDPRLYLALAWREHVIESAPSFTIRWDRPFQEIQLDVLKGWPTYRDYWEEAHGRARIETNIETKPVGRLLLRTSVALFRIQAFKGYPHRGCILVYSDDGFPCGRIDPHSIAMEKEIPDIAESFQLSGRRKAQLVALSCEHFDHFRIRELFEMHHSLSKGKEMESSPNKESSSDGMESRIEGLSRYSAKYLTSDTTYYDSTRSPLDPPPGIRVMMISWRGDVAYRVGLGMVLLRQWKKGNPTFRTIVLE